MNPRSNSLVLLAVASVLPVSCFVFPFLCGFFNLSQGWLMFLAFIWLFGPVAAAVVVAWRVKSVGKLARAGIGLITWVVIVAATVVSFFVFPAGAKTWTLGFAANFRLTKHPSQVQTWAIGVLDRYEAGQLITSTNAPYWAAGRTRLDDAEIPDHIRRLWWNKPSIGIMAMTSDGWTSDSTLTNSSKVGDSTPTPRKPIHCVAFSWYLTGIIVGRPDFRSTWNPWYIHEIIPGVYAYSGMK